MLQVVDVLLRRLVGRVRMINGLLGGSLLSGVINVIRGLVGLLLWFRGQGRIS